MRQGAATVLPFPTERLANPFPVPTVEEQVESIQEDGRESQYLCLNAWALRHRFVNKQTGHLVRARCDSWRCLYCGPRKVDQWRQLIKASEPVLFVTLTRVGYTVEEAARVLTTVVQRLRRGFKSKDPERKGYRQAYPIEYFAVLERHKDFERNGFHWHLLVKGVDFLPEAVVSEALSSATKKRGEQERSYIVKVQRIRDVAQIGYVTKYLTKALSTTEMGVTVQQREMTALGLEPDGERTVVQRRDDEGHLIEEARPYRYRVKRDEQGQPVEEREIVKVERVSRARRIRYSRHFFPTSVEELRKQLFAKEEARDGGVGEGEECEPGGEPTSGGTPDLPSQVEQGGEREENTPEKKRSGWGLVERYPFTNNLGEYRRRKEEALREVVIERREQGRRHSGRLLTLWYYQRDAAGRPRRWAS